MEIEEIIKNDLQQVVANSVAPLTDNFIKEFSESRRKELTAQAANNTAATAAAPAAAAPAATVVKEEKKEVAATGDPFVDSLIKANGGAVATASKINTPDEFKPVLKEKANVESFDEFFNKFDEMRTIVEKEVPTLKQERDNVVTAMSALPSDLFLLNQLAWEGKDWRAEAEKLVGFDFTQDVSKVGKKELVNYFYPGEFKDEDFEAPAGTNNALKIAEKEAVAKYKARQVDISNSSKSIAEKVDNDTKLVAASLESSFKSLDNSMLKEAPEDQKKRIKATLAKGKAGVLEIFMNPDGSFKEDAMEKAILAEFGKDAIGKIVSHVTKQNLGAELEKALETKKDTGKPASATAGGATADEDFNKLKSQIGLTGINGNRTFDHIVRKK